MELAIKPDKNILKQNLAVQFAIQSYFSSFQFGSMSDSDITEMMEDVKIKTKWNLRRLAISSMDLKVINNINGNENLAKDLQDRYNKLINITVKTEILDSKLKRFSIQELVYNDDYTIKEIRQKCNEYFTKRYVDEEEGYKWYYTLSGQTSLPDWKILVSENEPTENEITGKSELYSLYKLWVTSKNSTEAVNNIVEKYGIPIIWITYAENTDDADVEALMENAANLNQKSVLAFQQSLSGNSNGLNKDFGFVDMSRLNTDVHTALLRYIDDEYSKYFLGTAGLQESGTGSYAAKLVDNDIFERIVEADVTYIEEKLNQLLEIDGFFFGYNSNDYSMKLVRKVDTIRLEETRRKEAERLDILMRNFEIDERYISESQGIPLEFIKKKVVSVNPFFEKSKQRKEFETTLEKEVIKREKTFNDAFEASKKKITSDMSDAIKKSVSKAKSIKDINNITVDYPIEMQENLMLAYLLAYDQINSRKIKKEFDVKSEVEIVDIFNLPYDEALKYFQTKYPELWENLDTYDEMIRERFFWIKKTTDLEVTKKMQKSLIDALNTGKSFQLWLDNLDENIKNVQLGQDGAYLETVYRTNMTSAYSTGRYETQTAQKENFPYWQYFAIVDDRTSDICSELDGKIYRADDAIWNKIYPPNHFSCRSTVIALADYDMKEYGLGVDNSNELKETSLYKDFKSTSFYGNPAKSYISNMESLEADKKEKVKENAKELEKWT